MTIAAGFLHRDGIILCSDTQQEGGTTKYHGPKIGVVDIPFGKIGFAFAGNVDFAIAAIQSCGQRLKDTAPEDTVRVLTETVESEYRRLVFTHPDYHSGHLWYSLVLSLWDESRGECSLWATQDHSIISCFENFRPVGIGTDLANVIVRPFMNDMLSEEKALILMTFMMARVKETVPGCGGISQYVAMGHNGSASAVMNISLEEVEKVSGPYDKAAHELLCSMNIEDDQIYNNAAMAFIRQAVNDREMWKRIRRTNPEVRQRLGLTRDDPSHQPPSPESPGGSGES